LRNGGFSANFKFSFSIELLCKVEVLSFDFRHYAKLKNVSNLQKNSSTFQDLKGF
jgi:hypothetical protein